MCGIAGIVTRDVNGMSGHTVRAMCARMTHRGPDDEGFYVDGRAALGMLRLARDRLGIKPLYYWLDADRLVFASEMKCLLEVEGFERTIDHKALADYFTFGYVPGPGTIYEGVVELPPAHVATWSAGALRT